MNVNFTDSYDVNIEMKGKIETIAAVNVNNTDYVDILFFHYVPNDRFSHASPCSDTVFFHGINSRQKTRTENLIVESIIQQLIKTGKKTLLQK